MKKITFNSLRDSLLKKLITISLLLCSINGTYAQSLNCLWAKNAVGTGTSSEEGQGVAIDANGNVYSIGYFNGPSLTFGTTVLTNAGATDLFLTKYDALGNLLWAKKAGGSNSDYAAGIAIDAAGDIYITGGFFSPTITFGSTILTNASNNGGSLDLFVAKYNPSGTVLWATSAGGALNELGSHLTIDTGGNVYISGYFYSTTFSFGTSTLTNAGGQDILLLKMDASGNKIWAKGAGGINDDFSYGISSDATGNIFITGTFRSNSLSFGSITLTKNFPAAMFIAKYDATGSVLWAKKAGTLYLEFGYGVATDAAGNVFATGFFSSPTITFGSFTLTNYSTNNGDDIYLVKYDGAGTVLWAKSIGGASQDMGYALATNAAGDVYLGGRFQSPSIVVGNDTLLNFGSTDILIAKYDAAGNFLAANQAGGTDQEDCFSIVSGIDGSIYITGVSRSPSITIGNTTLTNSGGTSGTGDMYIAKLAGCSSRFTLYADTVPHNWIALNLASGTAPLSYLWNWGDNSTSPGATPAHIYAAPGNYNVCLTINDAAGCTNTYCDSSTYLNRSSSSNAIVNLNVIVPLSNNALVKNSLSNTLEIYPNPSSEKLHFKNFQKHDKAIAVIENILGEKIMETELSNGEINISSLANGNYIIKVRTGTAIAVSKFVKN